MQFGWNYVVAVFLCVVIAVVDADDAGGGGSNGAGWNCSLFDSTTKKELLIMINISFG